MNQQQSQAGLLSKLKARLLPSKSKTKGGGHRNDLVGVTISRGTVACVHVQGRDIERLVIQSHGYIQTTSPEEQSQFIQDYVKKNKLQGYPASFVISSAEYSLTMMEPPQVKPEEMREALQWGIKDYIDFSPEDAALDVIPLPFNRASDNAALSYVVIVRNNQVQHIEEIIQNSGLKLKYIDIPGLALRNLACLSSHIHKGCLALRLREQGGFSVIVRDGTLIQLRSIDCHLDHFLEGQHEFSLDQAIIDPQMDTFTVEIQRTMDYCRSLFRQSPVQSILLMPSVVDNQLIAECLKQNIGLPVEVFDLQAKLSFKQTITPLDLKHCLLALGGGLRHIELSREQNAATS